MRRRPFPPALALLLILILIAASAGSAAGTDEKIPQIDKLFADWDTTTSPGLALAVRTRTVPEGFIFPSGPDQFMLARRDLGRFTIDFVRGARNAVVGFDLSAGRMKGVSFAKK